ncbi:MAG: hypothetical protein AAF616_06035 [Bacteroidota bacterium]
MKYIVSFLAVCLLSAKSYTQERMVKLDNAQLSLNILPIMAHVEIKAGEQQSFTFGGGLAYSLSYQNVNGNGKFTAFSTPFLTTSFRHYYKRKQVSRRDLRNNSGNYVGLLSTYSFNTLLLIDGDTFDTDLDSFTIGPVWGIQRNYANGIHLNWSIGIGYISGQSNPFFKVKSGARLIGGLEFGFRLNK